MASSSFLFGFKNFTETVVVNVHKAEGKALDVPLISPISGARVQIDKVQNVGVRIELHDGSIGWGEVPV